MRKFDVVIALEGIADARKQWTKAKHEFDQGVNKVMSRLLHEAAANFMSAEEVSRACGLKPNQVRSMMRLNGLDPKRGKRALSATAADALATNASLLGIAPHEMDLMSPLAYLPMGKQLRQQLQDQTVSQVHELEDNEHAEFYAEHYSDWTVHVLPLTVYFPTKNTDAEVALAMAQEILDEAALGIRVSRNDSEA